MKLFIHRSIIVLLLLLQGISPLVHAHVNADGRENGLHIDGISAQLDKSRQALSFKSVGHADTVIGMQPTIQQKKILLIDLPDCSEKADEPPFLLPFIEKRIVFFSTVSQSNSVVVYSSIAPRAPPF